MGLSQGSVQGGLIPGGGLDKAGGLDKKVAK